MFKISNSRFIIFLLFCVLPFSVFTQSNADEVKTLSIQFERIVSGKAVNEITRGVIFFTREKSVVIEVSDPISQIMALTGRVVEIYYPESNEAFRIQSKSSFPIPFVDAILNSMDTNHKMVKLGYSLKKTELKNGVLYARWSPPSNLKKQIGQTVFGHVDDRIVSVDIYANNNSLSASSLYQKHAFLGNKLLPMFVSTKIYLPSGSFQLEQIIYSAPQINVVFPDYIRYFRIPRSANVKVVEF